LIRHTAVLLVLLTAGCASITPDPPVSQPKAVATQPETPQPAAAPVAPAPPQPVAVAAPAAAPPPGVVTPAPPVARTAAAPVAKSPAPVAGTPKPAAPAVAARPVVAPPVAAPLVAVPAAVAAPVATPGAPLTLDLTALKDQLKSTKAIGIFTKIALKGKVDDLLKQFRDFYEGKSTLTMTELRRSYDLLMMKVLSLLQDTDQKLASSIVSSREAIWGLLADRNKFANL